MGTYTLILRCDWSYKMLVFGIKNKEKEERGCRDSDNVGESPGAFDSLYNELPEILFIQRWELLCPDGQGAPTVRGTGRVYPTTETIMHNCLMIDGFVKVQVDRAEEGCGLNRLLPESCSRLFGRCKRMLYLLVC
ncbi:hypothetical protein HanHA300_Chr15g0560731 [Helianthus annuus]|nr:hypothetical protein HanHA300_Chr15g0560731 [Helianthus annuus]KAJ0472698.1 hypothetical protein HanHA89_Chr15g0609981 [Helianthus annuus]KAJ0648302.1 hypothetical protein HanLR1_Chr15g0571361 [Helianthus annuus]KAJ0652140.1 hypothetical protein HanOQP8_Chr15g0568781 [Helianthus annuus]